MRLFQHWVVSFAILFPWNACWVQADDLVKKLEWNIHRPGPNKGFRAISIPDAETIWICGGKSSIVRTEDGGKNWKILTVPRFPELEFRSIHAIDQRIACIASAGEPAVILRTIDGGDTWTEVYRHPSPKAFLDAFSFWNNQQGLALGDPVAGHWVLIQTTDAGKTWQALPESQVPPASPGEAAFAASSGSIFALDEDTMWVGSGGVSSDEPMARVYRRSSRSDPWVRVFTPLLRTESCGIFGVHFADSRRGVIVGGDYRQVDDGARCAAWTDDGGQSWQQSATMPTGFRSSVVFCKDLKPMPWVTVGPNGTDGSQDGRHWQKLSDVGFHVVRVSTDGSLWAAGSDGRIGHFVTKL